MTYNFVRLLLFFDLPMKTDNEKKVYTQFRKYLIKNGYLMMQFSVYCKIFPNREAAVNHITILRKNLPNQGQVRIMVVTEKQYAKMEVVVGGKSNQELIVDDKSFIKL